MAHDVAGSIPRITKPSQLARVVEMHWLEKSPLCIWGHDAIGKSQIVQQVARKIALKHGWTEEDGRPFLADVRLTALDPADIQVGYIKDVIPIGDCERSFFDCGILFFDELDRAMQQVVDVVFQLTDRRGVGRRQMLPGWSIVIAANSTFGCGTSALSPILLVRMSHCIYAPAHPLD